MRPFCNVRVWSVRVGVDDELVGEGLTQYSHKDVHNCSLCQLLGTVVKSSAHFYQQTLFLLLNFMML